MEILFGLILPIAVVIITYSQKQHEKNVQKKEYEKLKADIVKDLLDYMKALPPKNE